MLRSAMFRCLLGEPSLESLKRRKRRWMSGTGRPGPGPRDQNSHYKAGTSAVHAGQQSLVPGRTGFSVSICRRLTLAAFLIFSQQSGCVTLCLAVTFLISDSGALHIVVWSLHWGRAVTQCESRNGRRDH